MTIEPASDTPTAMERYLIEPLTRLWEQVLEHTPAVITAIVVLIGLWLVGRIVRAAVGKALGLSRIDKALADTRLGPILDAFRKGLTPSHAIAYIIYFAILVMAWMTAADIVGLGAVRVTLEGVLAYLPSLLSALLILALGGYLAGLARRAVSAVLKEIRSPYARFLEALTELLLLIVVGTLAINALGADMTLITANLTVLITVTSVTIAVLFVWSMRGPAVEIIANYYLRRMVGVGDHVELDGNRGTVTKFAAIGIMLREDDGREVFVPARHVLTGLRRREAMPDDA